MTAGSRALVLIGVRCYERRMRGALALLLVPAVAHAYRPFDGTDAAVAAPGELELELGPAQGVRIGGATTYLPGALFGAGVARDFELLLHVADAIGGGNDSAVASELVVKSVLRHGGLQGGGGPSLALEAGVLFPTVPANGTQTGALGGVIASQVWDLVTIHVNVEAVYGRRRAFGPIASVIAEGPENWEVRPVGELLVADVDERVVSLLGGAVWRANAKVAFDGAVRIARIGERDAIELRAGLTLAFAP